MSKVIPFLAGAAKNAAAYDAASKVLSSVGVSLKSVDSVSEGVALSGGLSADELKALKVHSTVVATGPSAALNPDTTYSTANYTVVRSVVPSGGAAVPFTEKLDKFPALGISTACETEAVITAVKKTAALAVEAAKEHNLTKITVFQKPQSAFKEHNAVFLQAVKEVASEAGLSVEVQTSQQATNQAIMFSENLGVVVAPDQAASDIFEEVTTGIAGGAGFAYKAHKTDSATIFAAAHATPTKFTPGANPTGLLLAAVGAMKTMGLSAEASKVEAAVKKVYTSKSAIPSTVQGGSADAAAFGTAVAAAM